jgi:hypothetical protein
MNEKGALPAPPFQSGGAAGVCRASFKNSDLGDLSASKKLLSIVVTHGNN